MSSFTALRVLVTLVVTVSVLSTGSVSMPLPSSSSPIAARRAPIQLMSTSPTPPLPPIIIAGQRRMGSFTQQRPQPIILTRRDILNEAVPRSELHEHIHEHIHGHEPDYYHYDHDYPDRWTQEEMDHHSDHWAYHHGLMDAGDPKDIHAHIHEHIHADKRQQAEDMQERGLLGDLGDAVRPLLAPLEILPGFVSIEKLLFGDGDQDGGLLKTVGGLLLRVQTAPSTNEYSFSLLASKHERTQVYLAPVNDTSDASCDDDEEKDEDNLMVRVKLPLLDVKGSAVLMCASFAVAPPSALSLEACHDNDASDASSTNGTSQFFTYTRSTGALAPVLQAQSSNTSSSDETMSAVKANTLAPTDDSTANNTATASDDSMDKGPSMVKMLMHFTLATNMTQSDDGDDMPPTSSDATSMTKRSSSSRLITRQSIDDSTSDDDASDDATTENADESSADNGSAPPAAAQDFDAGGDDDDIGRIFLAPTMLHSGSNGSMKACKAKK